jgi:hypothetical protein
MGRAVRLQLNDRSPLQCAFKTLVQARSINRFQGTVAVKALSVRAILSREFRFLGPDRFLPTIPYRRCVPLVQPTRRPGYP